MKQIRVWKVALLTIVTFGIYGIVWLVKRRDEMVKQYKVALPSGAWLVASTLLAVAGSIAGLIIAAIVTITANTDAITAVLIGMGVPIVAAFILSVWWMIRFGQAYAKITAGRVPLWWTIVFYYLALFAVVPVYQYYINRLAPGEKLPAKRLGMTNQFKVLSVILAIILIIMEVTSWMSVPGDINGFRADMETMAAEVSQWEQKTKDADRLAKEYDKCIVQLGRDFPGVIAEEDEAAYLEMYDACEEIRLEQNALVDEINQ